MSNLWLNLRIFCWHLQVGPDRPLIALKWNGYRWAERNYWPLVEFH